ncbi:MAG TPA: hypothetical protein VGU66_20565 [Candidatus Elarobacter sp.]|nr:hypothetical protein [Candidatus Elarobacter sp.]
MPPDPQSVYFNVALGVCLGIFVIFALVYFGRLFLLIEYRQWAVPGSQVPFNLVQSRTMGFWTAASIASVCGYVPECHNVVHIALLAAAGCFLALALRRLLPAPWFLPVAAVAFFLFTEPMLNALSWQATILDKLAVFFSALAIYLVARIDLRRADARTVAVTNLSTFLVVFAAYNSKEAAFSLVFSLIGLLTLRFVDADGAASPAVWARAARKALTYLAAPTLYGAYHLVVTFASRASASPADAAHNVGGSVLFNVYHYLVYMFNGEPIARALNKFPYIPPDDRTTFLVFCAIAVLAAGAVIVWRASRSVARWWVWAAISFALALMIPARTEATSAFYLLVPGFYLAILLYATVVAFLQAFPSRDAVRVTGALAALVLAIHLVDFLKLTPPYWHISRESANFVDALDDLRTQLARTPAPAHVAFSYPKTEAGYLFVQPPGSRVLAEYILPRGTPNAAYQALDAAITDQTYDGAEPNPAPAAGTISIVLGDTLRLDKLVAPSR